MFKYGPLVYITDINDDDSGNYYWPGLPPVAYDDIGIPIDENGNQCLPGDCILHLNYEPTQTEWNEAAKISLPTIDSVREWFDDNFLVVDDWSLCKYILRWYWWNYHNSQSYQQLASQTKSFEAMMETLWPDVQRS